MKNFILLIGLGVLYSSSIFASDVYIESIKLFEDHISVDVGIEMTDDENIETIKLLRKDGNNDWEPIHFFDDVHNLHYEDDDILDNHSYTYKVLFQKRRGDGLDRKSENLFSTQRKLTNWVAPRPDLKFKASDRGLVNDQRHDATISVYLSGKNGLKVGKVAFILDGFDPHNHRSVNKTVNNSEDGRGLYHLANGDQNIDSKFYDISEPVSQNFIDELRSRCFDVVFINWIEGAGDIEKNAKLFQNILAYFNKSSSSANASIVIGPSMGGLIARYAMASMEENNIEHNVELFISLDAPHTGANIPLAIQTLTQEAKKVGVINNVVGEELTNSLKVLNSVAAKQLLLYHLSESFTSGTVSGAYPAPEHKSFFDKLNALNNGLGWPSKCFKVGISNGSKKSGDKLFANYIDFVNLNLFAVDFSLTAIDNPNRVILEQKKGFNTKKFKISNYPLGVDNTQGGLIPLPYLTNKQTLGNVNKNTHSCFIPLPSALGVKLSTPSLNHKWVLGGNNILSKEDMKGQSMETEFDLCFIQDKNQDHIFIGTKTKQFVINLLDQEVLRNIEMKDYNTTNLIDYDRNEVAFNISVGEVSELHEITVKSGSLNLLASNKISIFPGFEVLMGSKHISHIGTAENPECSVGEASLQRRRLIVNNKDVSTDESTITFSVFPNPTSGRARIRTSSDFETVGARIEVWDSRGRKIQNAEIDWADPQININDFENGIYFVKLITENDALTTKILKK